MGAWQVAFWLGGLGVKCPPPRMGRSPEEGWCWQVLGTPTTWHVLVREPEAAEVQGGERGRWRVVRVCGCETLGHCVWKEDREGGSVHTSPEVSDGFITCLGNSLPGPVR